MNTTETDTKHIQAIHGLVCTTVAKYCIEHKDVDAAVAVAAVSSALAAMMVSFPHPEARDILLECQKAQLEQLGKIPAEAFAPTPSCN